MSAAPLQDEGKQFLGKMANLMGQQKRLASRIADKRAESVFIHVVFKLQLDHYIQASFRTRYLYPIFSTTPRTKIQM